MKSVEFTEDELPDLSEIARELFEDENDPRSVSYKRTLSRPEINWLAVVLSLALPLAVSIILGIVIHSFGAPVAVAVIVPCMLLAVYAAAMMKRTVICAVKIYQRYASDEIRNKCRFEPSCSDYMLLAIEKYGLLKGLKMGINRLKRCNINGGGIDYP
ncbi:MAG: membrane protein insertion efficiency factor YidD [Oscillospiraceae bacterium]|nr:membrane protein insertion efficiency factor YidD [Oscillospiraceae bacterium]